MKISISLATSTFALHNSITSSLNSSSSTASGRHKVYGSTSGGGSGVRLQDWTNGRKEREFGVLFGYIQVLTYRNMHFAAPNQPFRVLCSPIVSVPITVRMGNPGTPAHGTAVLGEGDTPSRNLQGPTSPFTKGMVLLTTNTGAMGQRRQGLRRIRRRARRTPGQYQ